MRMTLLALDAGSSSLGLLPWSMVVGERSSATALSLLPTVGIGRPHYVGQLFYQTPLINPHRAPLEAL